VRCDPALAERINNAQNSWMKRLLHSLPLMAAIGAPGLVHAEGLDFSGTVSMGLQATTVAGETEVTPYARLEGLVTYTVETDGGATFVLALEFDQALANSSHMEFLPGHR
jgi:hypothetical protein